MQRPEISTSFSNKTRYLPLNLSMTWHIKVWIAIFTCTHMVLVWVWFACVGDASIVCVTSLFENARQAMPNYWDAIAKHASSSLGRNTDRTRHGNKRAGALPGPTGDSCVPCRVLACVSPHSLWNDHLDEQSDVPAGSCPHAYGVRESMPRD
jgi:hypothetical protein